jgi:predicted PurR-regulated permease PerM
MLGLLSSALGFATFVFIILFVGVYGAADPQLYAGSAVRLIRPGARERGVEVLKTLGHALRLWLVGRILSMTVVAILTVIGLLIAGVPLAFTLGLIAGLLSFVPLMGPLVSSIPAILVGLSDSPMKAVWVIVVFCAVQFLETYFITPLIQKRAVATPLAVTAVVLVQMLYLEDRLGERVTIMGSG